LARKVLFKKWGGKYDPDARIDGLDKELVLEVLKPTKIYVKSFLKTTEKVVVKAAVHVTGDAYLKFNNLTRYSPGIGFEFTNFNPQPLFRIMQEAACQLGLTVSDEEMFRTFNMGWGFAIIVAREDTDSTLSVLDKTNSEAEQIGKVTDSSRISIRHEGKKLVLQ